MRPLFLICTTCLLLSVHDVRADIAEAPPALPPRAEADAYALPPEAPGGSQPAAREGEALFSPFSAMFEARAGWSDLRRGGDASFGRLSLRVFGSAALTDSVSMLANARLRGAYVEGGFEPSEHVALDVQELALRWTASPTLTLEAGRINIRSGVAQGFNPVDRFKADSLTVADSLAASDRREDRLGVAVVGAVMPTGAGLLQFGYAPRISGGDTLFGDADVVGLGLDRTNPEHVGYAKFSPDLGGDLALTALAYLHPEQSGAGVEASTTLSDDVIIYGEAFVQRRRDLDAPLDGAGMGLRAQTAIGVSWSLPNALVGDADVTVSAEHHYNGAGLDRGDLKALTAAPARISGPVRRTAARLQEPLTQHEFFTRIAWNDVIEDLDLAALAFVEPYDASGQAQISASYALTDNSALGLRLQARWGSDGSAFGAAPEAFGVQLSYQAAF